ncbi:LysR family transcriptional regulator [Lutimaribacter marinistellae]|uniref:LysR family transcriptional regulator n=1 Tax=Lutimaribacter marinistellae TaxID=1820329 RepID=A0ABV7THS7_9RHOB
MPFSSGKLNWDDLRFCAAVLETGSMSGAARLLHADPATVSRRLARLSEALGTEVYIKGSGTWQPNPALAEFFDDLSQFASRLLSHQNALTLPGLDDGRILDLTVSGPPTVISHVLCPELGGLRERAPNIRLTLDHEAPAVTLGQSDMMLTPVIPSQGRLIVRSLGSIHFHVYARRGVTPDWNNWVTLARMHDNYGSGEWASTLHGGTPTCRVQNYDDCARVILASNLVGVLPDIVARQWPGLIPHSIDTHSHTLSIHLCYHESRRDDPAIKLVARWIDEEFRRSREATRAWLDGVTVTQSAAG